MVLHGNTLRGLNSVNLPFSAPQGRFGRMFPLPAIVEFDRDVLMQLAGVMVATNNPDNRFISAGYTFLGQFIDHDITFDPTSSLEQQNDPTAVQNFRTPFLELDSVYGGGPLHTRYLYQKGDPDKLLIGKDHDETGEDLPRNLEGMAIIGDPRNDENLIVSQLHLIFMKFHNAVVDQLRVIKFDARKIFSEAQRIVRWHYQWIIVHEFLPRILGKDTIKDIFSPDGEIGFRLFFNQTNQFGERFIPVEFAVAGYRFGHSQIRPGYSINTKFPGAPLFPKDEDLKIPQGIADDILSLHVADISNHSGGKRLNEGWNIAWGRFFEMSNPNAAPHKAVKQKNNFPQLSKSIDTQVSEPLFRLAAFRNPPANAGDDHSRLLVFRNLMRSNVFGLPTGQWVAQRLHLHEDKILKISTLSSNAVGGLAGTGLFDDQWPLWFYILKEAEVLEQGNHLGPVGGHIVGETFAALLLGDERSYIAQKPSWTPMTNQPLIIPTKNQNRFTMPDLINFALGSNDPRSGV